MLEIMDHIRTEDWMALELDSYQADVLDDVTVVMEEAISSNLTYPNHLNNSAILGESLTFIATRNKGCSRPCLTGTVPTTERPERRVADKVEHFFVGSTNLCDGYHSVPEQMAAARQLLSAKKTFLEFK